MFKSDSKTLKLGASLRGLAFSTPGKDSSPPASGEFTSSSLGIVGVGVGENADEDSASIQGDPCLRRGTSVVQVLNPEELCLGLIGNTGTKFCVQQSSECKKASHALPVNKFDASSLSLYISDGKTGCFMEPALEGDRLDKGVVTRLLGLDEDFDKVRREFLLVGSQDSSQDRDIDLYARTNLDTVMKFKTPSKELSKSGGLTASRLGETIDSLITMETIKEMRTPVKLETELDISSSLNSLLVQVETLKKAIPTMAGVVDSVEDSLNQKTTLLYGSLQQIKQLEGTLGIYPKLLKGEGIEPTVWAAIVNVVTSSKHIQERMDNETNLLRKDLSTLKAQTSSFADVGVVDDFKNELVNILHSWKSTIEDLQSKVNEVETDVKNLQPRRGSTRGTGSENSTSSTLLNSLGIMGEPRARVETPFPPSVHSTSSGSESANKMADIVDRIVKIEKQQSEHGREGLNGSVRFCGITLTGKDDLGAWLDKHSSNPGGVPPYGVFADPQLLLHWVWITLSGVETSSARDMKDRLSISMTQDKTYAVDSCQHYVPLVFTGRKSSLLNTGGMDKSRLGTIQTFESWDDATGETGLKQQIAEVLVRVKDSISELIEETFEDQHQIRAFALAMLHTSVSFIEKLGTYMSETYNNFKDVMGNGKSVWGLVTFVVEQIFRKDFGQVRAKTIGAIDANNRASGIKIIWSAIKCVDVAQQFMGHGIKNAPAVSASYVRFVITHSNMGKVNTIVEENKSLKRKVDDLESSFASVKKLAESAKKLADQAISTANAAKKQKPSTSS